MIIRKIERGDIPACAEILCRVYNNEMWQCRWEQDTACAYLTVFLKQRSLSGI